MLSNPGPAAARRLRLCDAPPNDVGPPPARAGRVRRHGCASGAAVEFYTVVGGSHPWPNTAAFRATDAILDFFDTAAVPTGTERK